MSNTKLECPHCHYTLEIEKWNENMRQSISFGVADELIPEDIDPDEWNNKYMYEHESDRVDCPECGAVCLFADINAY
jgi:ribosomal protein S27AE